jgi:glycosyltransferase involved in cell wall biosynthesis
MMRDLTIISPIYNEESCIEDFWGLLYPVVRNLELNYKVTWMAIDNGSTDNTYDKLLKIHSSYADVVRIIKITRNNGPENAIFSTLKIIDSDIYCIIDADGEDPPWLIVDFLKSLEDGYQLAFGLRKRRHENPIISTFRKALYRLGKYVADGPFNVDVGEFSAFTKNVRDYVVQQKNSNPLIRLSLAQTGFKSKLIEHNRMPRISGYSKFPPLKLLKFSITHGLSVTTLPLRFAFYSLPFLFLNLIYVLFLFLKSSLQVDFLIVNILFLLAWLIVMISFISIYVARIYKNGLNLPNSYIDIENSIINEK